MRSQNLSVTALVCGGLLGLFLGVTLPTSRALAQGPLTPGLSDAQHASQVKEPAPDPNKKSAGQECKTADECQRHHSCEKVGNKSVCKAPERPRLPPGAVT